MNQTIEAPKLYNSPTDITLKPGDQLTAVTVPISPEGLPEDERYGDTILKIVGFDRSDGREFWLGRGWIITTRVGH